MVSCEDVLLIPVETPQQPDEFPAYPFPVFSKKCFYSAIADGWKGSMLATDLQDVLFGTPYPLQSEANLGVLKEDHVNLVIHGHEPVLSEMIVAVAQKDEMKVCAKSNYL